MSAQLKEGVKKQTLYLYEFFGKSYNLLTVTGRMVLRIDLAKIGFFVIPENKKYFEWFEKDKIGKEKVLELLNAVKFFVATKIPTKTIN